MFIAAVAHHYAFSYKPYIDEEYQTGNCCHTFLLIWDISDVRSDIREHVYVVSEYHDCICMDTSASVVPVYYILEGTGSVVSPRI